MAARTPKPEARSPRGVAAPETPCLPSPVLPRNARFELRN